jgi:glycosyltransferase involved in cell wall biosynthesis
LMREIVCLIWRPAGDVIRDGGFKRTYAILEGLPPSVPIVVIDRHPSPLRPEEGRRVREYRIPGWAGSGIWPFHLGRPFEALAAFFAILVLGGREMANEPRAILYVPTSEIPWVTMPAYLLAVLFRARLVLANLNTRIALALGVVGRILWAIHRRADQVIALSSAIAEELRQIGINGNVSINTVGFEAPVLEVSRPIPTHGAVFIGRLEPAKGIRDALDAWTIVREALPSVDLQLAGFGTPRNVELFEQERDERQLAGAVRWLGVINEESKWSLYRSSRLCLFLSHIEGWGIVPIEALCAGLPVIVYDLPCYEESLKGLEGVYKVALGDVEQAANRVVEIMSMRDAAYMTFSRRIQERFSYRDWSEVSLRELALITGTVNDHGGKV